MTQQYICSTTNSHECVTFDVFDTKTERKNLASDVGTYFEHQRAQQKACGKKRTIRERLVYRPILCIHRSQLN